ncbi:MAG: 7-carboxy-7-deazaguanine synthase QueE [Pseudomonadota bacterium]
MTFVDADVQPVSIIQSPTQTKTLRITEIFRSIQGESSYIGRPTVFVRLTGCPLRCEYCDSAYAFHGGQSRNLDDLLKEVLNFKTQHITVTGGEPLAQPNVLPLMKALSDAGLTVTLETSGALDIAPVDPRVIRIVDVKTPDSGEEKRNLPNNLDALKFEDEIKFVICSEQDFQWAINFCHSHQLTNRVSSIWMSPSYEQVNLKDLAEWVLAAPIEVRLQMQLHKLIWGDVPGV